MIISFLLHKHNFNVITQYHKFYSIPSLETYFQLIFYSYLATCVQPVQENGLKKKKKDSIRSA